jgi:hypothetical protein
VIENLADRIERAYRLRRTGWYRGCSTSRVWTTAAALLVQAHQDDPALPLDPELYVAVQPSDATFDDPWLSLAQPSAVRRYRRAVRKMISGLRAELSAEVRTAQRRIVRGEAIDSVLLDPENRLSPLSRYITALRAGRHELGEHLRPAAGAQHRCCPLYRPACRPLLPPEHYPVRERSSDEELVAMTRQFCHQPHLN